MRRPLGSSGDFADQLRTGLVGRPSLRRGVAKLGSARAEQVANQLSDIDPKRFRSLYKQRTAEILGQESRARAAIGARPGSYEANNDPNRPGSVIAPKSYVRQKFKTLYR